eukprot:1150379-Pelagomonas_calceolata.AAC.3
MLESALLWSAWTVRLSNSKWDVLDTAFKRCVCALGAHGGRMLGGHENRVKGMVYCCQASLRWLNKRLAQARVSGGGIHA